MNLAPLAWGGVGAIVGAGAGWALARAFKRPKDASNLMLLFGGVGAIAALAVEPSTSKASKLATGVEGIDFEG